MKNRCSLSSLSSLCGSHLLWTRNAKKYRINVSHDLCASSDYINQWIVGLTQMCYLTGETLCDYSWELKKLRYNSKNIFPLSQRRLDFMNGDDLSSNSSALSQPLSQNSTRYYNSGGL